MSIGKLKHVTTDEREQGKLNRILDNLQYWGEAGEESATKLIHGFGDCRF